MTALNQCKALPVNPAKGIGGKARKTRPLVWTAPRVEQWERDGLRPSPVMVWTREQAGAFLDHVTEDPWYSLWAVAVYTGMRGMKSPTSGGPTPILTGGASTCAAARPRTPTGRSR